MKKVKPIFFSLCTLLIISAYAVMDWSAWEKVSENAKKRADQIKDQIAKDMETREWNRQHPYWTNLVDQYERANAKVAGSLYDNALKPLTAIKPNNKKLERNALKQVRMVSLIPEWAVDAFYRPAQEKKFSDFTTPNFPGVYLWVTAYPELKNFIAQYNSTKTSNDLPTLYRVQQYLGLPPKPGKFYLVDFWVDPKFLFRPCPDSEILDNTCVTDMNIEGNILPATNPHYNHDVFDYITPTAEHKEWYKQQMKSAYGLNPKNPGDLSPTLRFPWTRFGYTYDWSPKSKDNVGITEFVIKQNTPIKIISITPFDEY